MKFFTHYWSNDTWFANRGEPLDYVAGNQFTARGVEVGDTIYVVTVLAGRLYLGGKMIVDSHCDRVEAARRLPYDAEELWEANEYLIAERATPLGLSREVSSEVVRALKFVSGGETRSPVFTRPGHLSEQTMRGVRQLTANSAAALDALLPQAEPIMNTSEERSGKPWSNEEVDLTVRDYFEMLIKWLDGRKFNKTDHRLALQPRLQGRTEASIEYKHQNISAALFDLELPYLPGYRPARNYQQLLRAKVLELLDGDPSLRARLVGAATTVQPPNLAEIDINSVFVAPPKPNRRISSNVRNQQRTGPPIDFGILDAQNRALGAQGEQYVLDLEKKRLLTANREDLASSVEMVSQTRGPDAGYDIRSFEKDGTEIHIEVKTTNGSNNTPFLITLNEVRASEALCESYRVYRVFDFSQEPKIYVLCGSVRQSCSLEPQLFRGRPA